MFFFFKINVLFNKIQVGALNNSFEMRLGLLRNGEVNPGKFIILIIGKVKKLAVCQIRDESSHIDSNKVESLIPWKRRPVINLHSIAVNSRMSCNSRSTLGKRVY